MGLADRSLPTKAFARTVNHARPDANGNVSVGLNDLSDVGGTTPDDGQTIIYSTVNNTWVVGTRPCAIDNFSITGTGDSVFGLTFIPVEKSWNVKLNGVGVHSSEFTLSGSTLTITNAADLFKGVTTQDSPWDLEVQYDRLGTPDATTDTSLVSQGTDNPLSMPTGVQDGDLIVVFLMHEDGHTITANGYDLHGPSASVSHSGGASGTLTYRLSVFTKVRTGGSSALPTFTNIAQRAVQWAVLAKRGPDTVSSVTFATANAATGTSAAPPSGDAADVRFFGILSAAHTIIPASGTKFFETTAGADLNFAAVADVPTGTLQASLLEGGTAGWFMATVVLT